MAVCDSLRNKTFACRETSELIKIGEQRHSGYIIVSLILLSFIILETHFNNHFPDIWKPLMNHSRFSFQMKIQRRSEKDCNKKKNIPYMSPLNFWNFVASVALQNCFNFVLACMTCPRHSEDQISHNRKHTVILYQLCCGWSQNAIFCKKTMVYFYSFVFFLKLGLKASDFWAQVVQAKY